MLVGRQPVSDDSGDMHRLAATADARAIQTLINTHHHGESHGGERDVQALVKQMCSTNGVPPRIEC